MPKWAEIKMDGDIAAVITMPRQLRFAARQATIATAQHSQRETIDALEHDLIIRGNWLRPNTRYGINVTFKKSGDGEASVFTRADWLLEEEGHNRGIKEPDKGGRHLAQPDVENTRHGIRNKVKAAEKARRLLQFSAGKYSNLATRNLVGATGAFKVRTQSGREIILQRVAATKTGQVKRNKQGKPIRSRGKNGKVIFKYALRTRVRVPQRKIIQKTVIGMTKRHFGEYYEIHIRKAFKTAKSPK